jgi:hypothetical protein
MGDFRRAKDFPRTVAFVFHDGNNFAFDACVLQVLLGKLQVRRPAVYNDKLRVILGSPKIAHAHESSILTANAEAHRYSIGRHRRAMRNR